ncbi:MAG TPA: YceI family protein [Urbifossiella sp.]|jgi:polyisoprenoid-binding protein YceI|nr:YceI family protein [Urbifossiella sp.]
MTRVLFAAALAALLGTQALATDFPLSGGNTKVEFVGTKPGGKHTGGFAKLDGKASVTGDPTSLKIDVTIDTDSLYSDDAKLTAHLKAPDFFSVKDHPKAAFKTTKVEKTATGYAVTGDLTMLGKTKSVTLPAAVTTTADSFSLTTEFKINKTDWGMTYGKGKIDDDVTLKVTVAAKK